VPALGCTSGQMMRRVKLAKGFGSALDHTKSANELGSQPGHAPAEARPPEPEVKKVALTQFVGYFLWLGTVGFGGPIALAGHMQPDLSNPQRLSQLKRPHSARAMGAMTLALSRSCGNEIRVAFFATEAERIVFGIGGDFEGCVNTNLFCSLTDKIDHTAD
jgi:hypothetical protein